MKVIAVLIIMILGGMNIGYSQTKVADSLIYEAAEYDAEFLGGKTPTEWVSESFILPDSLKKSEYGKMIIRFVIEIDGSVSNVKVVRGLSPRMDKAAIDMMYKMPKWKPAMNNGKAVRCRFTIPILIA
jgi:periplasmic protein TonB